MIYREDLRRLVPLAKDCPTLPSYGRYNHLLLVPNDEPVVKGHSVRHLQLTPAARTQAAVVRSRQTKNALGTV
jgi:hypothetical protein